MSEDDHEWQRDTAHPSAQALLAFLQADLDRGSRLVSQAIREATPHGRPDRAVLSELERVKQEVLRWVHRAEERKIPLGALEMRTERFLVSFQRIISG